MRVLRRTIGRHDEGIEQEDGRGDVGVERGQLVGPHVARALEEPKAHSRRGSSRADRQLVSPASSDAMPSPKSRSARSGTGNPRSVASSPAMTPRRAGARPASLREASRRTSRRDVCTTTGSELPRRIAERTRAARYVERLHGLRVRGRLPVSRRTDRACAGRPRRAGPGSAPTDAAPGSSLRRGSPAERARAPRREGASSVRSDCVCA